MPAALGALATFALMVASCNGDDSPATPAPAAPSPATVATTSRPDPAGIPCESSNPRFAARGTVSILGGSSPDAAALSGFDWITIDGCERVSMSFLTAEGAPASQIGLTRLEFSPEQGIVRVLMPRDVSATAIADVKIEGAFVERAFVVRSRNGDLAIDLHVSADVPIEARALVLGSPVRLVVDIQTGAEDPTFVSAPPTIGSDVVILSPSPGEAEYPLRIRGYARAADDVVTVTVSGGADPVSRRITAADSSDAWGEFAVTISQGPAGDILLEADADRDTTRAGAADVSISLQTP